MKTYLLLILLAFTQEGYEYADSVTESPQGPTEITQWFVLVDNEIVLVVDVVNNIDMNVNDKYIALYTDFIFNDGFEGENPILKIIR